MVKKFPLHPKHPERVCWGCDRYCPTADLACGNGSGRTEHPCETLGDDWYRHGGWGLDPDAVASDGYVLPHGELPQAPGLTDNGTALTSAWPPTSQHP